MITDLSVFILRIISESPTNPYEIAKFAERVSMQNWLQAPKQSIYSSIKVLEKKDTLKESVLEKEIIRIKQFIPSQMMAVKFL
ncbi:MAG TPA: hypothetical protein VJY54_08920 [Lachnospiraceae bacterium]|nr:hypothetical protein [Lachnospiraceae bacterium]